MAIAVTSQTAPCDKREMLFDEVQVVDKSRRVESNPKMKRYSTRRNSRVRLTNNLNAIDV